MKIYIADPQIRTEQIQALAAALPKNWTLAQAAGGVDAILTENVDVTPQLLTAAGDVLKVVFCLKPGEARVAETPARVIDLPTTGLTGVAEYVVGLMLMLSRRLLWVIRKTNEAAWIPGRDQPILTDQRKYTYNWVGLPESGTLYNKKVGIVGLGFIGRELAKRLRPFNTRLYYTDVQRLDPQIEKSLDVRWRELDDLLGECDFISLHLRFQEGPGGNDRMFGGREFGLMKPNAYFINTSRGRVVDEEALVAALKDGQIAGAALDVFYYEPLPPNHPLLAMAGDQVILTPHVSGVFNDESWRITAAEMIDHLNELC